MTRRRLPLEYIANDSARKAIFMKRKKGLFKKLHELSTLCGINACFVICSAFDPQPQIWPPSNTIVHGILTKFKEIPEVERAKRRINLEDYIKGRVLKAEAQRVELIRDTREMELVRLLNRCLSMEILVSSLPMKELNDLRYMIDNTVTKLSKRIEMLTDNVERGAVTLLSSQLPQPQEESPPVDQSQLGRSLMSPQIALPMSDEDDRLTAGQTSNSLGDDDVSDVFGGDWANTFREYSDNSL